MNKICGYICEHNKGGVCQITICDKQPYMTTTTITNDNSCGIRISNEDISTSTGKIIINGVEITDVKSWEKVISTLEEKDKEIERLKAREQECIDKYLVESKYRSEIEGKYVVDEYIINKLEKWLEENDKQLCLRKLRELKEGK